MIDVKIIKKAKQGHVSVGGGIATAGNSYTTGIQQTLADVLNFNAGLTRLLKPYDANNQPLTWAQATDPDGDGGIKAKTLRAAVTFASVGDIVAYQNGNLSGGTGGGGLDIAALEDYLTTNGYATQAWVSAHFNDYVLTKAAVEAVLTGNITSHTHSQYLTAHQSLANYYTKAESDGKYLPKAAYTASDILTKIKTVDGAGSGLDADMLDGCQETCFFRTHRGIIPTAYIDLTTYTPGATDYANYKSGTYIIDLTTHSELFVNLAVNAGSISALQFKTSYNDNAALYFRKACNSTHITGPWRTILTELNVHAFALTPSNYAATLDGRYYTESEINAMLSNGSVTKVGTATVGGSAHPIYLNAGTPTACGYSFGNATGNAALNNGTLNVSLNADMLDGVHLADILASNVASASKLQTARTIWGQSFDGTDNVAGSLSGVKEIIFNMNARLDASNSAFRFVTKGDSAQGIQAGNLLISNSFSDAGKVPANGIYSKGDISTGGVIKIGGGTISWDAGNNAFMFSHTVASQGDMVAFQNGNLSGGTGGGGMDITALEDYLTTNGYATQAWVSAHFNDYVLTKAAVEAVLTGNITTHTHNQYLTEHQSLANYYTKTESDGKYLTAINKSMVEAVLTGNITSHTHSQYLTEHQSLANYMTRGEIGDTYQTKNAALSFTAATGYVAARFTDAALATAAVQNYIELWGNDGWFNLQAGYLLAHGAVTATQFIRTGGTASQFLKADGSVDANTYLTTGAASDTYLPKLAYTASDILTKIKTVDGAGSGLDADTLDGVHGKGYMYYNVYDFANGYLVRLKLLASANEMVTVHIKGNSCGAQRPIDTWVQFYNFNSLDNIFYSAATHNGYDFGDINVFCYDGHVYLWFKQTNNYQSFSVYAECTNEPRVGNLVEKITDAAMPTEGVTRLKTIVPKKSALITDNVASATKLQTARIINGTAFDGTAAITTAKWGTARNLTIGNTAKSVDGSSAMAWSLAEIGALGVNANAVSASKLATPHTLWGQSFDGTDNVAGTLSGVEDIIFNANARLNATDNALRFFTKSGGAQGIQAGNLLISNLFSDANKVPENGIYSKDGLVTDGSIKIGGGTITWDEATNSFIFSHTVASQGDVVAFKQ